MQEVFKVAHIGLSERNTIDYPISFIKAFVTPFPYGDKLFLPAMKRIVTYL